MIVEMRGDWRKLRHISDGLQGTRLGDIFYHSTLYDLSEYVRQLLLEAVHQKRVQPGNAPSTIKRKKFDKPYVETGDLMSTGIVITSYEHESNRRAYIVEGSSEKYKGEMADNGVDNTINYRELFYLLEYGNHTIPGRFLFTRTYQEAYPHLVKYVIADFERILEVEVGWDF